MLTERQNKLIQAIIQQYIKTAQPVASEWLAKVFDFQVSPATIRNEMVELTDKGFLFQPHTSAGRIPTEKAYRYYIENFLDEEKWKAKIRRFFKKNKIKKIDEIIIREISRKVAELAGELIFLAFNRENFYYTGLSYLFQQPEFNQAEIIYDISRVVDHLDKIIYHLFDQVGNGTEILLGRENPFGEICTTILTKIYLPWQKSYSLFGLLGPMRMNYNQNIALVNYIKELIS